MPDPGPEHWLEEHIRFTQGDKTAGQRIVAYFLAWLIRILQHRYPSMDAHLIAESADDALVAYWKAPKRFDVTRGVPLSDWLSLQTRGYLANGRRKEQNHQRHERAIGVEDQVFERNTKVVSRMSQWDDYLLIEGEAQGKLISSCPIVGRSLDFVKWASLRFSSASPGAEHHGGEL